MPTTVTSRKFTLDLRDVLKGLLMAVILPVLTIIQQSIADGELSFNWRLIGLTAAGGFVGYIIKNFLSPTEVIITNPPTEDVKAIKQGDAEATIVSK